MSEPNKLRLVICNVPDDDCARRIADALLTRRLAACVNVLAPVRSHYHWHGKIEEAQETTLLIKTTAEWYAEVETAIAALHPYEVPEIIAVPVVAGLARYVDWVESELGANDA